MPRALPTRHGGSYWCRALGLLWMLCSKLFTKHCHQVLAAITAGSVAPLDETLGKYFPREKEQEMVAGAMFSPRKLFITVTGAPLPLRLGKPLQGLVLYG